MKYINADNLKLFLVRCSYIPNDNLVMAIIRRMDLDCDAKLNLLEFIDALSPQNIMKTLPHHRLS